MHARTSFRHLFAMGLPVFLLLASLVLARIVLCPRCGHEIEPGLTACPHCQNAVAAAEEEPVAPEAAPAGDTVISPALLASELASARAALTNDFPALAWLRARNLAGLLALGPPSPQVASGRSAIERAALAALHGRERDCPVCQGDGDATLLFVGFSGEASERKTPGTKCPACDGSGHWPVRPTADQLELIFGQAQRNFLAGMRESGWTGAGGLWLPPGLPALDLQQQAASRSAVAGPCDTCRGLGATACETCTGAGRIACTQSGCVGGHMLCPDCQGTRRATVTEDGRTFTRRCATCRQTGVVVCPVCEGRAYLTCSDCGGSGESSCPTCKGTGEKVVCKSCSGTGLRAARGKGGVEELCKSCGGTGRGKK